jgi:preprotein translocase subunit SecD
VGASGVMATHSPARIPGRPGRPRVGAWRDALVAAALFVALGGCGIGMPQVAPQADFAFRITYQAVPAGGAAPTPEELDLVRSIIASRLDTTGIATLRVSAQAPDKVIVEAAPASVLGAVRALAGATGRLDVVPLGDETMTSGQEIDLGQFPPLFSGDQVASASIGVDQTGQRTVDLTLKDEAKRLFADYTAQNIGKSFALVLDGKAISSPVIRDSIPGGQVRITQGGIGGFSLVEAQNFVTILQFGQIPIPLQEVGAEQL